MSSSESRIAAGGDVRDEVIRIAGPRDGKHVRPLPKRPHRTDLRRRRTVRAGDRAHRLAVGGTRARLPPGTAERRVEPIAPDGPVRVRHDAAESGHVVAEHQPEALHQRAVARVGEASTQVRHESPVREGVRSGGPRGMKKPPRRIGIRSEKA